MIRTSEIAVNNKMDFILLLSMQCISQCQNCCNNVYKEQQHQPLRIQLATEALFGCSGPSYRWQSPNHTPMINPPNLPHLWEAGLWRNLTPTNRTKSWTVTTANEAAGIV